VFFHHFDRNGNRSAEPDQICFRHFIVSPVRAGKQQPAPMAAGTKLPRSGALMDGNHVKRYSRNATIDCRSNFQMPVKHLVAGPKLPPVIIAQQLFATKGVD